jgi:hypothetical protein
MTKFSDSQLVVLSTACQRPDANVFPITLKLKGNAINNVLKSLVAKGLLEEIPGRADETIWRYDDDGAPLTLRATPAAFEALGIGPENAPQVADEAPSADTATTDAMPAHDAPAAPSAPPARKTREGSKQARLVEMLKRPEGAIIDEISAALGWQARTVRGAIAGALKKKLGLEVISNKVEGRGRVYRIG